VYFVVLRDSQIWDHFKDEQRCVDGSRALKPNVCDKVKESNVAMADDVVENVESSKSIGEAGGTHLA